MLRLDQFDLFLFDFDGLLVNTELLHQRAYQQALAARGHILDWDFKTYATYAHESPEALRDAMQQACPALKAIPWELFREAKQALYEGLLTQENLRCMEGVEAMLNYVHSKKAAVVTNSPKKQVDRIREHLPILNMIKLWFPRESYAKPKPSPSGYLAALRILGPGRAIGFEDSFKGIVALKEAGIEAVCICPPHYPAVQGADHTFSCFTECIECCL